MDTRRLITICFPLLVGLLSLRAPADPSWDEAALHIAQFDGSPSHLIHRACRGDDEEAARALLRDGSLPTLLRRHERSRGLGGKLDETRALLQKMSDTAREAEAARHHCNTVLERWRLAISYPNLLPPEEAPSPGHFSGQARQCLEIVRSMDERVASEVSTCLTLSRSLVRVANGRIGLEISELLVAYREEFFRSCRDDLSCELSLDAFRVDRIPWIETEGLRGLVTLAGEGEDLQATGVGFFVQGTCESTRRIARRWLEELRARILPSFGGVFEPEGFAASCILSYQALARIDDQQIQIRVGSAPGDDGAREVRLIFLISESSPVPFRRAKPATTF